MGLGLATFLKKLATENGVELDADELDNLGLSDDDVDENILPDDPLGETLSGEASGAVEIFLSEPCSMLAGGKAIEGDDNLMYEPIIRTGQWAVRPGPGGQKVRRPLKVVAGKSKNQRKEIGLADIKAAFDDRAIEHVTVPLSHENKVDENTGFIQKLKIVEGTVTDKKTKKDVKVHVLLGGYDIRKPHIKESMQDGSIASRSAGLLYDYVNTETGKTYPVALEHVALTNKPWITGMKAFGRKLAKKVKSTVGLSLSDVEPDDVELLADDDVLESIELADATLSAWTQDEDPNWLREQTNAVLSAKRAEKAAKLMPNGGDRWVVMDGLPHYRCVRAKPGMALIADGWNDEANYWTAPISVVDGYVQLDDDLSSWQAVKREYINDDDRKEFPEGREPLADESSKTESEQAPQPLSGLALAQAQRRQRAQDTTSGEQPDKTDNTITPRGGEHMAGENGTLHFSEEAQALIRAAEERARAAEAEAKAAKDANEKLSQDVAKLMGAATVSRADAFCAELRKAGLSEENGFTGVLAEVHAQLSADDGGPAVQSDHFSDDTNTKGELTLSEAIGRIFKAFERGEDGQIKLGQQVKQPVVVKDDKTELGDDGKPLKETPEDKAFEELSEDEQLRQLAADNPNLVANLRLAIPAAAEAETNGNGQHQEGGEK